MPVNTVCAETEVVKLKDEKKRVENILFQSKHQTQQKRRKKELRSHPTGQSEAAMKRNS